MTIIRAAPCALQNGSEPVACHMPLVTMLCDHYCLPLEELIVITEIRT